MLQARSKAKYPVILNPEATGRTVKNLPAKPIQKQSANEALMLQARSKAKYSVILNPEATGRTVENLPAKPYQKTTRK